MCEREVAIIHHNKSTINTYWPYICNLANISSSKVWHILYICDQSNNILSQFIQCTYKFNGDFLSICVEVLIVFCPRLGQSHLGLRSAMWRWHPVNTPCVWPNKWALFPVILGGRGLVWPAPAQQPAGPLHPHLLPTLDCSCTISRWLLCPCNGPDLMCLMVGFPHLWCLLPGSHSVPTSGFLPMDSWGCGCYPSSISDAYIEYLLKSYLISFKQNRTQKSQNNSKKLGPNYRYFVNCGLWI